MVAVTKVELESDPLKSMPSCVKLFPPTSVAGLSDRSQSDTGVAGLSNRSQSDTSVVGLSIRSQSDTGVAGLSNRSLSDNSGWSVQ